MPKQGEFSDGGISVSEVHLFIALNYLVCNVSYGAIRIVLRLVDPFGANWLVVQLHCFLGVDLSE